MLEFEKQKKYWYFNRHSTWEIVKFVGTVVNQISHRTYYLFRPTGSSEVLLTATQVGMYIRNL